MGALKLHTLKQKLWAIVAASFVARVIVFFALPNTPSLLAPDEGTYALLAQWVANGELDSQHPYYTGLFNASRSLILPSSLFVSAGVDELSAIRLTSSIYGLLSLSALAFLSFKFLQSDTLRIEKNKIIERLTLALLMVYAFMPSHFTWSILGLRESPNEFWLMMSFIGVLLLYNDLQSKKLFIAVFILISIVCTFSSRPQVGWVLVVTLLIYSLFKLKNKVTYLQIGSVLTGLYAGYLLTTSFTYVTSDLYIAKLSTPAPTKVSTPAPINRGETKASRLCNGSRAQITYEGSIYNCVKTGTITKRERPSNLAEMAIDQVEVIPDKQIVNQVGAASVIDRLSCPWQESSEIGKYGCVAFRAPYMTLTFLFRPLPFVDTTSLSSTFAAAENALWIFMFALIVFRMFKVKRIPFFRELAPSLIFFTLYVVGAGSYEGNMGTAFRHKSLILWIVLLLFFVAFWRSEDVPKRPRGNNSQESAV